MSEEIRLSMHKAQRLPDTTQVIEVKRGNAWVTIDNEDIIIKPGEPVTIHASDEGAVISATGRASMVFTLSDLLEGDKMPSKRLAAQENQRLENKDQVIEVKRGNAWVTVGNEDIVIGPGEAVTLRSNRHSGVISAAGRGSMVFEVREIDEE